ncbi:MAG: hypothetical protein K0R72_646 [Clostridia bacterium]|jgi:hypothetical protein|nr:hypothetical protein [Clostridia bacterium]
MYKRIFIVVILLIISLAFILFNVNYNKHKVDINVKKIAASIDYYNKNVLTNKDKFANCFNDRYIIINDECLSIGKNKNELDNGYYDINLKVKEKYIEIYVNKLFKEFDKNNICDENYVKELVEYIINVTNLQIDKPKLCQIIIESYDKIRDMDRSSVINIDKSIEINHVYIKITEFENMLMIKLGDNNE